MWTSVSPWWEAAELGPGHALTWRAATVAGAGVIAATAGQQVEATIQARDECGRAWAGESPALRATLVRRCSCPYQTHVESAWN
jgi:hypothetical protein